MARKPGDEILRCLPYAHVLTKTQIRKRCHFCFASIFTSTVPSTPVDFPSSMKIYLWRIGCDQFEICSGCQTYTYCDIKCQELDWPIHKSECQCLVNVLPEIPSDSTRIMLRLVIRRQNGDDTKTFGANKLYQRRFVDLMSHYSEMKTYRECYDRNELSKLAGNKVELPSHDVLLEIYGKMLINSFQIPDEFLNKIGTGLFLSSSKLNHSCAPNCAYTYNGSEQIIRALTHIEQPTPEKMFVSYIDNAMPSWERRELLCQNYYFHCMCRWCVQESKQIDQIMTSVRCPDSLCFGFSGFTKDESGRMQLLPCSSCGKTDFPVEFGKEALRLWVYGNKIVKELKQMDEKEDHEGVLKLAENVLSEFDESILHKSNLQFIRIRELAKGACIELELWEKAAAYGEQVYMQKIKCVPHPSSSIGLQLFEQGKLLTNALKIEKALGILIQAENILRITHGIEDSIYLELQDLIEQCEDFLNLPNMG